VLGRGTGGTKRRPMTTTPTAQSRDDQVVAGA
jgi:hypothetical protein